MYGLIAAAYEGKNVSEQIYRLTDEAIKLNPASYTAWYVRRGCIRSEKLQLNFNDEISFVEEIAINYPKNFQVLVQFD